MMSSINFGGGPNEDRNKKLRVTRYKSPEVKQTKYEFQSIHQVQESPPARYIQHMKSTNKIQESKVLYSPGVQDDEDEVIFYFDLKIGENQ